ncbi:MAG: hypothetical protein ACR2M6_02720 [Vampirovibrionia bacterium]
MKVIILQGTQFSQKDLIKSLPSHLNTIFKPLGLNFILAWDSHAKWWTLRIKAEDLNKIRAYGDVEVVLKHLIKGHGVEVSDVIEYGCLSFDSNYNWK